MNEAQLFELLGRKQAKLEEVVANYSHLVAILRGIKDGSVSLDRLAIDESGIWTLSPVIAKEDAA